MPHGTSGYRACSLLPRFRETNWKEPDLREGKSRLVLQIVPKNTGTHREPATQARHPEPVASFPRVATRNG